MDRMKALALWLLAEQKWADDEAIEFLTAELDFVDRQVLELKQKNELLTKKNQINVRLVDIGKWLLAESEWKCDFAQRDLDYNIYEWLLAEKDWLYKVGDLEVALDVIEKQDNRLLAAADALDAADWLIAEKDWRISGFEREINSRMQDNVELMARRQEFKDEVVESTLCNFARWLGYHRETADVIVNVYMEGHETYDHS